MFSLIKCQLYFIKGKIYIFIVNNNVNEKYEILIKYQYIYCFRKLYAVILSFDICSQSY